MQRRPGPWRSANTTCSSSAGGAFGAAAARDAALRGLSTVLIERHDFGGGASAECFKMVHGGIRYLQHADMPRLRASCHERSALLRIAPHLVSPLPIAIPTYGHGRSGKAFLGTGARVYDLLTLDRNRAIRDPARKISNTQLLSRTEVLAMFPHLQAPDLSGAVVFEDGQMYNAARLVLAFVKGAVAAGADVCNYAEATQFLWSGNERARRARSRSADRRGVRDSRPADAERRRALGRLSATRSGAFWHDANACPSPAMLISSSIARRPRPTASPSRDLSRDKDALLGRQTRHLFAAPVARQDPARCVATIVS